MRVHRESVLRALSIANAGVSSVGIIEQSNCFVFCGGRVFTFNEEIAVQLDSPFGEIEGAVPAASLLGILEKLPDEELDVAVNNNELLLKAKRRRSGIHLNSEILLPLDAVGKPKKWQPLESTFAEALAAVQGCTATEGDKFYMTCVHITPEWLEACDNYQMARFKTAVPIKTKALCRQKSLEPLIPLGITEVAQSRDYLHFRNETGAIFSIRSHSEDYLDLSPYFKREGEKITFPSGLDEAVLRAEVFTAGNSSNHITIRLTPDKLQIDGKGVNGWYKEVKQASYSGPPVSFVIKSRVFAELNSRSDSFYVAANRLVVSTRTFSYATSIGVIE